MDPQNPQQHAPLIIGSIHEIHFIWEVLVIVELIYHQQEIKIVRNQRIETEIIANTQW